MSYDIIGDVHGQEGKLTALLAKLGYQIKNGAYRHSEGRTALFLGDLIDRGPGQVEVINIVRKMIDAGNARTIMGNHELNAIGFATERIDGKGFLRLHSNSKVAQHKEFLRQVGWQSALHSELVGWFKTLPPFLDMGDIHLCHAWWKQDYIDLVAQFSDANGSLDNEFLLSSFQRGSDAWAVLGGITKGLEVDLPSGYSFSDHTGTERNEIRVRWWDESATTYRKAAMVSANDREHMPDIALPETVKLGRDSCIPVFVGHYWLTGTPAIQNAKTAVLDYGAAIDGPLVAYRWNGESNLENDAFVAIR